MRAGIMQPYFLPYIGYFQLVAFVDVFVIYDNIKYTKKGWINRNRLLLNGRPDSFGLPLKSASDDLEICEREIAESFSPSALLNRIAGAYRKSPHFRETIRLVEDILAIPERNLFDYLKKSLEICNFHLEISTPMIISSMVNADHNLKAEQRVISICKALDAEEYINPIGGVDLYSRERFESDGLCLKFLQSRLSSYSQFCNDFVPALSILDVLFFNGRAATIKMITEDFDLREPLNTLAIS